jgi:putative ABC transport system permease protein
MLKWLRSFAARAAALTRRPRIDREFEEELDAHLSLLVEENLRRGLSPDEAWRAARVRLGGSEQLRTVHREQQGLPWLEAALQDLRYAIRILSREPGFSAVIVITLALGVGANTAIFTVLRAALLRPLPYANPGELVTWSRNESLPDVVDIRSETHDVFSAGGAVNPETMDYTSGPEPLAVRAGLTERGFFEVLGVPPMLGRALSAEEDQTGGRRAAVLMYPFWRDRLAGDRAIVGKAITLDGNEYTVVGVMPEGFTAPEFNLDVLVALRVAYPEAAAYRGVHFMAAYWRLRPGVTLARARVSMAAIDARLAADHPAEERGRRSLPMPLQESITGELRPALWVLFGAVTVVLLIAAANFGGLLMARAVTRRREMALRAALGGMRMRLVRQALTENILLAVLGGCAGIALSNWATQILVAAKPAPLEHVSRISVDSNVLLFGLAVSLVTGLVFGFVPAWSGSRSDAADALKQEGRTASAGLRGLRFRTVLAVGQMALALVLLVGAGLLFKSFAKLSAVDPGFNAEHVLSIPIRLPEMHYAQTPKQTLLRRGILERLNALPGVKAAMVSDLPLSGDELTHAIAFEGRQPVAPGDEPAVQTFCVMGDYFRTMQIPIRAGRALNDSDREDSPLVAVVNRTFVDRFYAGQNPIGQRIRWARDEDPQRWMTIVGVVADNRQTSLANSAVPAVFSPFAQSNEEWRRWMSVVVRTSMETRQVVPAVKREIWSLDSRIPLDKIVSMDEVVGHSMSQRRFNLWLLGLFSGLAMALAAIGIYSVISYSVSQRTHEIGIRMAVGARRADVLGMIVAQGMRLAVLGLAVGVAGAVALTRVMASLLFEVTPTDPLTFIAVAALMMTVLLVACFIPALRAMQVEPMHALRYE